MATKLRESLLDAKTALLDETLGAGLGWTGIVRKGQIFRIVDLEGNQSADTFFYNADDPSERYSAVDTVREQGNIYVTTGTRLLSTDRRVLMTVVADTCGRHDTLGGACSAESNQVRYAIDRKYMHSCRDTFLLTLATECHPMGKRDLSANVNFFMNVPVTPEGGLDFADGVSGPGRYVEMRAEMDVRVLISNCPQLNNPCNAFNPTPLRLLLWKGP